MTRAAWFNDSGGHPQKVIAIWFNDSGGHPHKCIAAWVKDSQGHAHQWWPPAAGPHPPTSHTVTLAGHRSGSRWTFSTASYKGHITHATLILHSGSAWTGNAIGYPSGGTLASHINTPPGGGSASRTVSAAAFNGATHGVTLHTTIGSTTAVNRVSLRITYTK